MPTKRKSKGAYMISAVAEMYEIHPQTLRLYEREGLLQPSRTVGNTRLYTDEDLERLEFILNLARELGVNIAGIAIILQMRERMEEMNRQMQDFVDYVRTEMLSKMQQGMPASEGAIVALRRPMVVPGGYRASANSLTFGAFSGKVYSKGEFRVGCKHDEFSARTRHYRHHYLDHVCPPGGRGRPASGPAPACGGTGCVRPAGQPA